MAEDILSNLSRLIDQADYNRLTRTSSGRGPGTNRITNIDMRWADILDGVDTSDKAYINKVKQIIENDYNDFAGKFPNDFPRLKKYYNDAMSMIKHYETANEDYANDKIQFDLAEQGLQDKFYFTVKNKDDEQMLRDWVSNPKNGMLKANEDYDANVEGSQQYLQPNFDDWDEDSWGNAVNEYMIYHIAKNSKIIRDFKAKYYTPAGLVKTPEEGDKENKYWSSYSLPDEVYEKGVDVDIENLEGIIEYMQNEVMSRNFERESSYEYVDENGEKQTRNVKYVVAPSEERRLKELFDGKINFHTWKRLETGYELNKISTQAASAKNSDNAYYTNVMPNQEALNYYFSVGRVIDTNNNINGDSVGPGKAVDLEATDKSGAKIWVQEEHSGGFRYRNKDNNQVRYVITSVDDIDAFLKNEDISDEIKASLKNLDIQAWRIVGGNLTPFSDDKGNAVDIKFSQAYQERAAGLATMLLEQQKYMDSTSEGWFDPKSGNLAFGSTNPNPSYLTADKNAELISQYDAKTINFLNTTLTSQGYNVQGLVDDWVYPESKKPFTPTKTPQAIVAPKESENWLIAHYANAEEFEPPTNDKEIWDSVAEMKDWNEDPNNSNKISLAGKFASIEKNISEGKGTPEEQIFYERYILPNKNYWRRILQTRKNPSNVYDTKGLQSYNKVVKSLLQINVASGATKEHSEAYQDLFDFTEEYIFDPVSNTNITIGSTNVMGKLRKVKDQFLEAPEDYAVKIGLAPGKELTPQEFGELDPMLKGRYKSSMTNGKQVWKLKPVTWGNLKLSEKMDVIKLIFKEKYDKYHTSNL